MTDTAVVVLAASVVVHAAGLAWTMRRDVARVVAALRRRFGRGPSDLDYAMFTVWLESGKWRWSTEKMTTEAREAAVAAVLRYSHRNSDRDELLTRESLAWWD